MPPKERIPDVDRHFMKKALELSLKGRGQTSPNPLVGAVIVRQGKIVGQGFHPRCGAAHAEIFALRDAPKRVAGATLYVTLEPCFHYGRTPPCVDVVLKSGIRDVVIGMKDPNPLTQGKSIAKLKKAGCNVRVGILEMEIQQANQFFIKYITRRLPWVTAKWAQTLDGRIAAKTGHSHWVTGRDARHEARQLRKEYDAILVGVNTVLADDPGLNAPQKVIKKIILDSTLRTPFKARLFRKTAASDVLLATTARASGARIKEFRRRGVEILICPEDKRGVSLKVLFKELAKKQIASILVEGGGQTIGSALRQKLVDKMIVYMAPKVLGDAQALPAVSGFQAQTMRQALNFNNVTCARVGKDFRLESYVQWYR